MSPEIKAIGDRILGELKTSAKDAWARWTPDEKKLVEQCSMDAAQLSVMAIAGIDVTPEQAQIRAQLANIKASATKSAADALWGVASKLLQIGAAVLLK